jgi:hypothetical protein
VMAPWASPRAPKRRAIGHRDVRRALRLGLHESPEAVGGLGERLLAGPVGRLPPDRPSFHLAELGDPWGSSGVTPKPATWHPVAREGGEPRHQTRKRRATGLPQRSPTSDPPCSYFGNRPLKFPRICMVKHARKLLAACGGRLEALIGEEPSLPRPPLGCRASMWRPADTARRRVDRVHPARRWRRWGSGAI